MKHFIVGSLITVGILFTQCKKETQPSAQNQSANTNNSSASTTNSTTNNSTDTTTLTNHNNATPTALTQPKESKAIQQTESGKYTFNYKLEVGKTYPMTIVTDNKSTLTDGKQTITEKSYTQQKRSFQVIDMNGANYIIKVKDISRSEKITGPNGKTISYNTAGSKPTNKDLATNFEVIKIEEQNPVTVEMTPKGKIVDVKGLDALQQKIIAKLEPDFKKMLKELPKAEGRPSDADAIKNFKEGIKASYSQRAKIADLEQNLNVLPKKDLKVGEGWTDQDSKSEGNNSISFNNKYTLENVKDQQVIFSLKGTSKAKSSNSKDGFSVFTNSDQNLDGNIQFDQQTGWINKATFTQKTTTKETQQYQGKKVNGTKTQTTKITVN